MQTDLKFDVRELRVPAHILDGAAPTLDDAREMLQQLWGFSEFRDGQGEAVAAVLAGSDVMAVLPTGAGKSAIYQVLATLLPGTTLVVSPLIALMIEQVENLQDAGVPAAYINSSLSAGELDATLAALEAGKFKLCYIAPERFERAEFRSRLSRIAVPLFVVDEAHCVSEWGHNFRPAYARLGAHRELAAEAPVLAVTATATPEVRHDIISILRMRQPHLVVRGIDRPNLFWEVLTVHDRPSKLRVLAPLLLNLEVGSAIVYVESRAQTEEIASWIASLGVRAAAYHAELDKTTRRQVQQGFMASEIPVVVATSAFGMGIDKSDVRLVVHFSFPSTLETYYQQAGRAGRDGEPAHCLLLYSPADRRTHEIRIEEMHPGPETVRRVYQALDSDVDEEGRLDGSLAAWSRRAGIASEGQTGAAVRILATVGVAINTRRGHEGAFLRLACDSSVIRSRMPHRPSFARDVLSKLWTTHGQDTVAAGITLKGDQITALGKDRTSVKAALKAFADAGILQVEWENAGCKVLRRRLDPHRLPIDWAGEHRVKQRLRVQLAQMEAYARTAGCRRRHLVEYFGDPRSVTCTGCDRCAAHQWKAA